MKEFREEFLRFKQTFVNFRRDEFNVLKEDYDDKMEKNEANIKKIFKKINFDSQQNFKIL